MRNDMRAALAAKEHPAFERWAGCDIPLRYGELEIAWSAWLARAALAAQDAPQPAASDQQVAPAAEPETVPWPTVTRYKGGASHEGIGGRIWVRLDDSGREVEYVPAQAAAGSAKAVAWMEAEDYAGQCVDAARRLVMTDAWKRHLLSEGGHEDYCAKFTIPLVVPQPPATGSAEPVATLHDDGCFTWKRDEYRLKYDRQRVGWRMDVYAAPQPPAAPTQAQAAPSPNLLLEWAVMRWREDVQHRPLVNIYRAGMDKAWRQVIRHAGGDPEELIGPASVAAQAAPVAPVLRRLTAAEQADCIKISKGQLSGDVHANLLVQNVTNALARKNGLEVAP